MEIELKQILLQLLNFGVLLALLTKFLYKPILKLLDARSQKIADGQAAAEASLKEAAKMEERRAKQLSESTQKAASIIAQAKAESKKMGAQIVEEARTAAIAEVAKLKANFATELEAQEAQLKTRLAKLVVETTKVVLKDSLKASELKTITTRQIAKLK